MGTTEYDNVHAGHSEAPPLRELRSRRGQVRLPPPRVLEHCMDGAIVDGATADDSGSGNVPNRSPNPETLRLHTFCNSWRKSASNARKAAESLQVVSTTVARHEGCARMDTDETTRGSRRSEAHAVGVSRQKIRKKRRLWCCGSWLLQWVDMRWAIRGLPAHTRATCGEMVSLNVFTRYDETPWTSLSSMRASWKHCQRTWMGSSKSC